MFWFPFGECLCSCCTTIGWQTNQSYLIRFVALASYHCCHPSFKNISQRVRDRIDQMFRKFGWDNPARTTGRRRGSHSIQYLRKMIRRREPEYNSLISILITHWSKPRADHTPARRPLNAGGHTRQGPPVGPGVLIQSNTYIKWFTLGKHNTCIQQKCLCSCCTRSGVKQKQ